MSRFRMGVALGILALVGACSQPASPPAAKAASQKVLFEDGHVRFVEYTIYPGESTLEAVAYPSVMMTDAAWPDVTETAAAAATSAAPETGSDIVLPPDNRANPRCRVESPRAAKTVNVTGDFPQHYYRLEYKRVDGKDFAANWQSWYADVFAKPAKPVANLGKTLAGKDPHSAEWPYNIGYAPVAAAPANHTLRFADDHIELVEVVIRPGETENMHGHPYSSVYADDGGFAPAGSVYSNVSMVKGATVPWGKLTSPLDGGLFPICFSAVPEPPHQVTVKSGPPQHFYRVHFKRVDGDDVKTNWQTWYPTAK